MLRLQDLPFVFYGSSIAQSIVCADNCAVDCVRSRLCVPLIMCAVDCVQKCAIM